MWVNGAPFPDWNNHFPGRASWTERGILHCNWNYGRDSVLCGKRGAFHKLRGRNPDLVRGFQSEALSNLQTWSSLRSFDSPPIANDALAPQWIWDVDGQA